MTDWAPMFRPGFPGVKTAKIGGADISVQFLREPSESGDGPYQLHSMRHAIAGLESDVGGVRRKDAIEIEGVEYQAVTDAQSDGDGVCTIILEPAK
ncbi:MAG: hypothetical protein EOM91_20930 [Sphingobacteriia bacterium]|nr:hypothetical protein [Sphingobacteriia bacterium]